MPSFINTNVASLNAQRNLSTSQSSLNTSLQRLSSGMRINSAKDDAAGLAISERMTSQIGGLNQAVRNANDGISLAQTAEGDLTQIGANLQRIRDLAVQSSNASNSASDRAALNNEASQLISEINRVSSSSNFNGVNLLDGSFTSQSFQVGANSTSNDQITISSIASAKSSALGVGSSSSYSTTVSGGANNIGGLASGDLVINGFNVGASSSDGVSTAASSGSAIAKASAINAVSAQTGVTASVNATTVAGTAATGFATAIAAGDIKINGVDIGALAVAGTASERGSQVAGAINAKATQTGVTATFDSTTGAVSLTAVDGRNINIAKSVNAGANDTTTGLTTGIAAATAGQKTTVATVNLSSTSSAGIVLANGGTGTVTGATAASTNLAAGDLVINGVDIGAVTGGTDATTQGAAVIAAINAKTAQTGVTAANAAGVITLTGANNAGFTVSGTATGTTGSGLTLGTTTGKGADASGLTAGAKAATATVGAGVSSLNLSTASGAQDAIKTLDAALANVNASRASLGAYQNRFASAVSSLNTTSENLTTSRSRIRDADFAQETASLTRSQVLQQAGTAILAQANALPQGVLSLLRG
jgi:flagellin